MIWVGAQTNTDTAVKVLPSWRWKQDTGACSKHFTEGECRGCEQRAASAMQHSLFFFFFFQKIILLWTKKSLWWRNRRSEDRREYKHGRVEFWGSYCGVKRIEQEILFVSIFSLFLNQTHNSLKEKHTKFWGQAAQNDAFIWDLWHWHSNIYIINVVHV